jgi:hypothetical protein
MKPLIIMKGIAEHRLNLDVLKRFQACSTGGRFYRGRHQQAHRISDYLALTVKESAANMRGKEF